MTDLLKLRITHIKPEIEPLPTWRSGRSDVNSYFLESTNGQPVSYRAGQFLTLLLSHNNHEVRRSYSLSSAPIPAASAEPLRLTIKRVENGEISRYLLDTLRVGDILTSLFPAGRFTLDINHHDDLVMFGAGSGITPLFSLLKYALLTEPNRNVTLLYSNPNERTIIFKDELNNLQRRYPNRFRLIYLLSNVTSNSERLPENVRRGRLNNVMLGQWLPDLIGISERSSLCFYVCGPADYMRMVQFTLVFSGIRPEQILREDFVIKPVVLTPPLALAQDRTVLLRIRKRGIDTHPVEGREVELDVPAHKSILQAALDEGIALPYSCRGGRCSTCLARCTAGRIHMTINDVLTERDLVDGWVLTCTGYPETDGVILEI